MNEVLGVDIGGTGIKAAPVDTDTGELLAKRKRIKTPHPATPDAVVDVVEELVDHFSWEGPIGIGIPAVVRQGVTLTASNLDKKWIGFVAGKAMTKALGRSVSLMNDADAAGLAEVAFGAAKGVEGTVVVVTLGTGIGSAVFADGRLLTNTELGHLKIDGVPAEDMASAKVKEDDDLSWKKWGRRLDEFLDELDRLLWPELFIIGGGISDEFDHYCKRLDLHAAVTPAEMRNEAGIVGAALATQR